MAITSSVHRGVSFDKWAVLLTFAMMPVVFVSAFLPLPDSLFGRDSWLSAWFWVPIALVSFAAFLQRPPSRRAVRSMLPFLVFLFLVGMSLLWTKDLSTGLIAVGRLSTFALLYFAAWTATRDKELIRAVKRMSLAWIVLITVGFGAAYLATDLDGSRQLDRLMAATALNLVVLFVVRSLDSSAGATAAVGLVALATTIAADARMASVVLILLLVLAPSWVVPRFIRPVAGVVALIVMTVLLSVSIFGANWWFLSGKGAMWNVATATDGLDLSGRAELWPAVMERCEGAWVLGSGVGSSSVFAHDFRPTASEPHNEYLRLMCDNGVVGSAAFALFLVMIGIRAVRTIARTNLSVPSATATLQLLLALLLFGITDIPLVAAIQFLAPAAVIWAWSDRLHAPAIAVAPPGSVKYP